MCNNFEKTFSKGFILLFKNKKQTQVWSLPNL